MGLARPRLYLSRVYSPRPVTVSDQRAAFEYRCRPQSGPRNFFHSMFQKQMFIEHQEPGLSRVQIEVLGGSKFLGFLEHAAE